MRGTRMVGKERELFDVNLSDREAHAAPPMRALLVSWRCDERCYCWCATASSGCF